MMMKQMTLLLLVLFGTLTVVRGNDDFQDVFNGHDLTGWKGKPGLWRVEEGAIVGKTVKGEPIPANTFLVWQGGVLGDFEFTAQVRFRGNNSGVQYRSVKHDGQDLVLSGSQGMGWHKGALYLSPSQNGLYRVKDSNGDDQLDRDELLAPLLGQGEHGIHAVFDAEDGTHLYVVAGNGTPLPDKQSVSRSRVASWGEDLLLPRQWDPRGGFRGVMAPGGWISLFDPATQKHEVFCIGFRNQYDVALNTRGDLFTYDSDMEWDLGLLWYRPTRISHVVSGGDYGWRNGSGKWPSYYEDSLPPLVEIGLGSPTGVVSGRGAKFPARYQHAIFALDRTYGRILAVHVEPDGAGYKADWEAFIAGAPLPVTDAVVASDGHLYVITGGRGAQSALLRVRYTGGESTAPAEPAPLPEAARKRRSLEAFHAVQHPRAIETAWPHLASEDRFLRHAARVAIESQPLTSPQTHQPRATSSCCRSASMTSSIKWWTASTGASIATPEMMAGVRGRSGLQKDALHACRRCCV